ncbi:MAG: GNAT family N-acetyltransferase [Deltaproteobacteria bacterium]|nr:GNAT family N-acetyltransferase [Deltaproteobacteria bacterium]
MIRNQSTVTCELIVSKDTVLRLLERADASLLFALALKNLEYLAPWLPWACKTLSLQDIEKRIDKFLMQTKNGEAAQFGIWHQKKLLGGVAFFNHDLENHIAEIGFWITSEMTGQGIATYCCRTLLRYLFEKLELNRIEMRCAPANSRSHAMARRLNFSREGVLRECLLIGGKYDNLTLYSLLRKEWLDGTARDKN